MEIDFFIVFGPLGPSSAVFSGPAGFWVPEELQFVQMVAKAWQNEACMQGFLATPRSALAAHERAEVRGEWALSKVVPHGGAHRKPAPMSPSTGGPHRLPKT